MRAMDPLCRAHFACAVAGFDYPDARCCPAPDGSYVPCCPLDCAFDGLRCGPVGRTDAVAVRACAARLRPDGKDHWEVGAGPGALLCDGT